MTTQTIYAYTCEVCETVAKFFTKFFNALSDTLTVIGYARTAAELTRQGHHEQARYLMTESTKIKEKK